ncbi:MAG: LytTR family DNA-binding domain-containing protein [Ignavibacteriota bacterium]
MTAYDQYAMRAFDAHAVDYLLKPFSRERFEKALERARLRLGEQRPKPELAAAARAPEDRPQRIVVKDGPRVHVIPVEKLDYVEAQDDYVALHSGGKSYLKQQPIASLEALLDPARFVRIHRSVIVNLERVSRIEPYGKESRLAILSDGSRCRSAGRGMRDCWRRWAIRRECRGRGVDTNRDDRSPQRRRDAEKRSKSEGTEVRRALRGGYRTPAED